MGGLDDWSQQFTNKQVRLLVDKVAQLEEENLRLSQEIVKLEQKKADRRGPKPKTLTSG